MRPGAAHRCTNSGGQASPATVSSHNLAQRLRRVDLARRGTGLHRREAGILRRDHDVDRALQVVVGLAEQDRAHGVAGDVADVAPEAAVERDRIVALDRVDLVEDRKSVV